MGCAPCSGSETVNVLPCPGALSTWTAPPCAVTIWWTMESPMPVPVKPSAFARDPRTNFSKMARCSVGGNSDAFVADANQQPAVLAIDGDRHRPLLRRVLDGIVEQIPQGVRQRGTIAGHLPGITVDVEIDANAAAVCSVSNSSTTVRTSAHASSGSRQYGDRPASRRPKSSRLSTSRCRRSV